MYLDINDVYTTDQYDRLGCVVYIDYDDTYFQNVNQTLLDEGVAVITDYPNEFSPYDWSLICPKEVISEFPSFLILPLVLIGTIVVVIIRTGYEERVNQPLMY